MDEEKLTFKDLLRKHHIVLGAVAAQAGVEIRIAYTMEQGGVLHGVYADRLLAALSHLTGQTYTRENVGGIYLHQEYHDGPYLPWAAKYRHLARMPGFSDTFIDYFPSLLNTPIQYSSVFISYSSCDQVFAKRLYADLQSKGVRCWFAPENMKIGDKIRHRIDESILLYDKLLIVLSEHSVAISGSNMRWKQQ